MTIADLDPRLTFDSYVVGPANRLASAAARRAADSPGTSYNPLFIYSGAGLGKTHILVATAHRAKRVNPDLKIAYVPLKSFLDQFGTAFAAEPGGLPAHFKGLDMLVLDDVEVLAGQAAAEEFFLAALADLAASGGQVVLASSRAPSEIHGLDPRLISRFSGGLIVDIANPEYETRVDIVRKQVENRGGELAPGVAELIGRVPAQSVREVTGVISRIIALQELEGRLVSEEEIPDLVSTIDFQQGDEFGAFVDELASEVATTVEVSEAPWRRVLGEALDSGEGEGYNCGRLRRLLEQPTPPPDLRRIVEQFTQDIDRLRAIRASLVRLGNPWPEAALGVLRDPDRMEEAEALLTSANELTRSYPLPPGAVDFDALEEISDAVSAVRPLLSEVGADRSPLYLWSPKGAGAQALLLGLATDYAASNPEGRVAYIAVRDFAEDFIRALTAGVAGAWRERWWKVELLLVDRVQDLSSTERARDELFHLFEAVQRSGGRIALAADRAPSRINGIGDRIRARLESGLVVEVDSDDVPELPSPVAEKASESFDPVLGAPVLDTESLDEGFSDILRPADPETEVGFPETTDPAPGEAPGRSQESSAEGVSDETLLEVDADSFETLDDFLVDGAAAATNQPPVEGSTGEPGLGVPAAASSSGEEPEAASGPGVDAVDELLGTEPDDLAEDPADERDFPAFSAADRVEAMDKFEAVDRDVEPVRPGPSPSKHDHDGWNPSGEEVVWSWPNLADLVVEEAVIGR